MNDFSKKLKEMAKKRGLKGKEIAQQAKMTPIAVSYILNGKTVPYPSRAKALIEIVAECSESQTELLDLYGKNSGKWHRPGIIKAQDQFHSEFAKLLEEEVIAMDEKYTVLYDPVKSQISLADISISNEKGQVLLLDVCLGLVFPTKNISRWVRYLESLPDDNKVFAAICLPIVTRESEFRFYRKSHHDLLRICDPRILLDSLRSGECFNRKIKKKGEG